MDINAYIHDSDRKALAALKAIPGFTPLLKAFMKIWSEKQFLITNMSTNLHLTEKQGSKYWQMLTPICEKLEIKRPELYIELDVVPNAYTSGENEPFIVITTGLLENMPEELIPAVLAHECGHIACHHVLYHMMGDLIINGASGLLGLNSLVSLPLQIAFYYWMRCSEYSADRVAALYTESAEPIIDYCIHFSGYDKDFPFQVDRNLFMEQAIEFKKIVDDSKWNKTLEFLSLYNRSHPFNSVRAYEINKWVNSPEFPFFGGKPINETPLGIEGEIPHVKEKVCPYCGCSVADGKKFCSHCGGKIIESNVCSACGAEFRDGAKFCPICGKKV